MLDLPDLNVYIHAHCQLERWRYFISVSKYKYINVKRREKWKQSAKTKKIYHGTGGCSNVYIWVLKCSFRLNNQGWNSLTSNHRWLQCWSYVQTKGESMWLLTTKNLHPAFQKNAGRKSPTELGMCQGRCGARMYHSSCSHDTHNVREAAW